MFLVEDSHSGFGATIIPLEDPRDQYGRRGQVYYDTEGQRRTYGWGRTAAHGKRKVAAQRALWAFPAPPTHSGFGATTGLPLATTGQEVFDRPQDTAAVINATPPPGAGVSGLYTAAVVSGIAGFFLGRASRPR